MKRLLQQLPGRNGVVPTSGFSARLTVFAAAAMTFLAVFVLGLAQVANGIADRWQSELVDSATLRVAAPADELDSQTDAALEILRMTPGITSAELVTAEDQIALLEPWFGAHVPLAQLDLPRLIAIRRDSSGFDPEGLRLRLQAEVPGAVLDDHERWRTPLLAAAERLTNIANLSLLLIATTMAVIVALAAQSALAANDRLIGVLRVVGATDGYITRVFTTRFTLRAMCGAAAGAIVGKLLLTLVPVLPRSGLMSGTAATLSWPWLIALPAMVAVLAYVTTWWAANRTLKGLT
ncbi:cell division protein FtsX [Qingshengfaniella alkalisoli]|uniref:FtsX-like permease family protein n=1 Tax=Qingshengfaniella alkalisoli TaxID=2599296 RepID=A0A5B8I5K9_9RHOB|nr:FtsX-like permease family protein [Qingshengfaniella alkalisoli]QDY68595.1 FtsX-like permease family protein [Qingshengfaniella alkalisoli]